MKTEQEQWHGYQRLCAGELLQEGDVRSSKADYTYSEDIPKIIIGTKIPREDKTDFFYYRPFQPKPETEVKPCATQQESTSKKPESLTTTTTDVSVASTSATPAPSTVASNGGEESNPPLSATPRTDEMIERATCASGRESDWVNPNFARTLERELNDVLSDTTYYIRKEKLEQLERELSEALRQRDEANGFVANLRDQLSDAYEATSIARQLRVAVDQERDEAIAQLAAAQEEIANLKSVLSDYREIAYAAVPCADGMAGGRDRIRLLASDRDSLKSRLAQAETERHEARASEAGYVDKQGAIMQENSILKSRLAEAEKVLDVFARCYRLMQPLNLALDTPMQDCCPRAWTFLSHLKAADDFLRSAITAAMHAEGKEKA